jgi:hypothetical protein
LVAEYAWMWRCVGVPLEPAAVALALGMTRVAWLLPVPGAAGTLEASQLLAASILGLDPAAALGLCALIRARDLLTVATGLALGAAGFRRPAPAPALR